MDIAELGTGFARLLGEIKSAQLPNTFALEGKDAESRKKSALLCAAALVCENSDCPCLECSACKKVMQQHHPDITSVPRADGESVKVDDIRYIRQDAYVTPFEADKKVYIFDNAQKLNVQSQNALLKILEEPPHNVYFILTCPSVNMLLPTVSSRCARYSLGSLGKDEIYRSVCEIAGDKTESEKNRCASAISKLESFETNRNNLEALLEVLSKCEAFYKTGEFPREIKKEDAEELKLTLKVLSLCALECLEYKKGASFFGGILSQDTLYASASRLSVRSALGLYEFFCEMHERLCANGNVSAVISAIILETSKY